MEEGIKNVEGEIEFDFDWTGPLCKYIIEIIVVRSGDFWARVSANKWLLFDELRLKNAF